MMLLGLLLACTPSDPKVPSDCASVSSQSSKDDCYAKVVPDVFRTDPDQGIAMVEKEIQNQTIRDFVYLKVTREIDPSTPRYCDKIKDTILADRCRVLVSRPHLHRGLTGQGGEGGAPPPPGAPPGSPPPGSPGSGSTAPPPEGAPPGSPDAAATPPPGPSH